jgi:membrane-bound serine protease (ClpP class)
VKSYSLLKKCRAQSRRRGPAVVLSAGLLALGLLLVTGGVLAQAPAKPAGAATKGPTRVYEIRINGVIQSVTAEYIEAGFRAAEAANADVILITMDTPGGTDDAMREIIRTIIRSPIPVIAYVTPSGSRAASAGFFILLSADVAAMSPGTNTGAASPVFIGIGGSESENTKTLRRKATNDAAAYMRSIVGQRGRNVALAEQAVTEAKAFSEKEALQDKLIDLVAANTDDLLKQLDGRTIKRFDGSTIALDMKNVVRESYQMNRQQRFLSRLAQPDLVFILFLVGILGLYVEFNNPGLILPGVVGGVSLILALVGMQVLPINLFGVLLMIAALGLFILEAKYTSHGLLALGGVVAMLLGAMLLIRSPMTGLSVSLGTALGVTVPFGILTVFLMRQVIKSFGWKQAVGAEALVGKVGEVTQEIDGKGMVFVAGELWRAAAAEKIPQGARVRVTRVEGLTVQVEIVETTGAAPEPPSA